jgi:[protein-PII] uridylyltransferase
MRQTEKRGGSEVLIYCFDRDNLFAVTTTMLDQLALSIVNARIMSTTDGHSLNSYLVLEQDGSPVELGRRSAEIINTLSDGLYLEGTQPFKVTRRIPRKNKHFDHKTFIYFTQEPKLQRTTMRLVTLDRPGLLSNVGQAFAECKIRLKHSKITTLGAQVEDIFFITDRDNNPIFDEEKLNCLKNAVENKMSK